MHSNSYTQLRAQELLKCTKPFQAKGKSVKRCESCQLAAYACICDWRPKARSQAQFVLLMHRKELFKPTNTGRLIADAFDDCQVFLWDRLEPPEGLKHILNDPNRDCYLVFPCSPNPEKPRKITQVLPESDRQQTFILLDGSWKQCSRMVALSQWLDGVPCLKLPEDLVKSYQVRDSGKPERFSTAEAAISCLRLTGEVQSANVLMHYFNIFNQHYLATRGCYPPVHGDSHCYLEDLAAGQI